MEFQPNKCRQSNMSTRSHGVPPDRRSYRCIGCLIDLKNRSSIYPSFSDQSISGSRRVLASFTCTSLHSQAQTICHLLLLLLILPAYPRKTPTFPRRYQSSGPLRIIHGTTLLTISPHSIPSPCDSKLSSYTAKSLRQRMFPMNASFATSHNILRSTAKENIIAILSFFDFLSSV